MYDGSTLVKKKECSWLLHPGSSLGSAHADIRHCEEVLALLHDSCVVMLTKLHTNWASVADSSFFTF